MIDIDRIMWAIIMNILKGLPYVAATVACSVYTITTLIRAIKRR
jgi:ABC-type phosphate/phosphonate transport system permease subunit